MNFSKPAGSVFAHIAKHGSPKQFFPRHSTITQLRQPTQAATQTDEDDLPSTNNRRHTNTPRRSYASATRANTHFTTTPHSISLPSTLPSLQVKPSLTRTPASTAVALRRATTACDSTSHSTTPRLLPDPSDPLPVEPIHPSLPPKPTSDFDLNVYQQRVKHSVQTMEKRNAEYHFSEITKRGITPNFATFNLMLKGRADWSRGTQADTNKLIQLYDEMVPHFEPDDASHSAVFCGLSVRVKKIADSLQNAKENKYSLAESTPQNSVQLEKEETEHLLLKTELEKSCNLMWEHFQSLSEKSPEDFVRIAAAISFQTDAGRMDELRSSVPQDAMTSEMYCYLIKTYGFANQLDKAKKIFEEAILIPSERKINIANIYKIFVEVCLKNGETAEVVNLVDSIFEKFSIGGGTLQNSIIQCYETGNASTGQAMLDRAEQIWPGRTSDMVEVDPFTRFLCRTFHHAVNKNSMEFASHLVDRLLTKATLPVAMVLETAPHLERYLRLCLVRRLKNAAIRTVQLLLKCKITPHPKSVSSLLLSEGKFDESLSIDDAGEILVGITANLINPKRHATEWVPFSNDYRSLVKHLADGMMHSRRFALSVARLRPREAADSWTEFIAKINNAVNEMHPVIPPNEYPMALELAARSEDKDQICAIVNTMRDDDLVPPILDTPTYDRVLEAITGKGDLLSLGWWRSNASRLANHAPSFSKPPSLLVGQGTFFEKPNRGDEANALVRNSALESDLDAIRKNFHKAIPGLSFGTVQLVFRAFGAKKDFVGAQSIAAIMDEAANRETRSQHREFLTRMSGSGLAISCIYGKEFNSARDILEYMVNRAGVKPEADVYAYYLGQQKWADPTSSAYKIFQEVLSLKIKPTTYFLNTLLHKFGLGRRMDHAFEVFDQFKKNRLMPDDITYGSAINAAVRVANEEVAVGLFSEYLQLTRQKKIKKTCVPFNIMMQYYVGVHKNRDAVLFYWDLLHREGNYPSRVAYQSLLQAYTCLLPVDMNSAETILKQITEPTGSHFAALIFGYGYRLRDFNSANAVMDRMLQRLQNLEEVIDPEQAWEALVVSYAVHREIQLAKQARDRMVESMPRLSTLYLDNSLIRGCALFDSDEGEHVGTARALYDDMAPALRTPDTYTAMIAVYQKFGHAEAAKEVLTEMLNRRFPSRVTKEAEKLVAESDPKNVQHWVMTNMLRLPALQ